MVLNLKESGLLTDDNYEEFIDTMLDDLDNFSLNSDGSGLDFVNALNSFVKFIAHYFNSSFCFFRTPYTTKTNLETNQEKPSSPDLAGVGK